MSAAASIAVAAAFVAALLALAVARVREFIRRRDQEIAADDALIERCAAGEPTEGDELSELIARWRQDVEWR